VARVEKDGAEVIIAGAGLAAHLPGVIASMTVLPVIGVPLDGGKVGGLDALLSIVQMPKQIPVATVGLDNAANAAYLACEILAIKYPELKTKLLDFRKQLKTDIAAEGGKGVEL
jgi:5-(carboxyamino)imidazole ribonucleotide mutase